MGVPRVYRGGGEVIQSFDFTDVISGAAIEQFTLGTTKQDTTETFVLGTNDFYSDTVEHSVNVGGAVTPAVKQFDHDYDILVNIPRVMKGTALVNIPHSISAGAATAETYIIVKIRKYSAAAVETDIAQGQTSTITAAGGGTQKIQAVQIVVPRTNFAVGDTIRLTIEVWVENTSGAAEDIAYAHSPKNRDGTIITVAGMGTTILTFQCPFEVLT